MLPQLQQPKKRMIKKNHTRQEKYKQIRRVMPFTWAFYCHLWRRLRLLLWVFSPFRVDLSLLLLNFKQKIRNMWPIDTWVICYDDFWSCRLLHRYSRAIMIIENQMEYFPVFFRFVNLYRLELNYLEIVRAKTSKQKLCFFTRC